MEESKVKIFYANIYSENELNTKIEEHINTYQQQDYELSEIKIESTDIYRDHLFKVYLIIIMKRKVK